MKTKAIIISVISSHVVATDMSYMADTPFCGVMADARNHLMLKVFPVLI
jgi:hypothetical protein